jgi:hypothetical protein
VAETRTSCERCGAPTVEIGLLKSSAQLLLRSCSRCDLRTWLQDGRPAPMEAVLAAVSTSGRRRSA